MLFEGKYNYYEKGMQKGDHKARHYKGAERDDVNQGINSPRRSVRSGARGGKYAGL